MADIVVDLTNGNDGNAGTSWGAGGVDAKLTFQAGNDAAGLGGRCFVQIDMNDVATTKDTAAVDRTLTFPGTDQVPFGLYGVKNGTTAYPPTDSDLCVRGTDALPVFEAAASKISFLMGGLLAVLSRLKELDLTQQAVFKY